MLTKCTKPLGLFLTAAAMTMSAPTAFATGTIECTGVGDDTVSVFISVGRVPVLAVLNADISARGDTWSTRGRGTPIVFGQGTDDEDMLRVDFTDDQISERLISVRTVKGSQDKLFAEAGVLRITGHGAYAIVCESG
ncbi:MAG: hypothetical protein AAFO77_13430 [Pseudomonadota bacterium]